MALKLRPTGLGSGIDKDRPDYTAYSGERDVGRISSSRTRSACGDAEEDWGRP